VPAMPSARVLNMGTSLVRVEHAHRERAAAPAA
jgi:hypothetical protein